MKIGFNCSTLDLMHAGHVTMFQEERRHCDYLIVALQTDPTLDRPHKNRPVQSIYERFVQLTACRYVDEVLVYATEADLMHILQTRHIDIRFLGDEYRDKYFTGRDYCLAQGIELFYHQRHHPFSSTNLRRRVYQAELDRMEQQNQSCTIDTGLQMPYHDTDDFAR